MNSLLAAVFGLVIFAIPLAAIEPASATCYSDRSCTVRKGDQSCKTCLKGGGPGKGWKGAASCLTKSSQC